MAAVMYNQEALSMNSTFPSSMGADTNKARLFQQQQQQQQRQLAQQRQQQLAQQQQLNQNLTTMNADMSPLAMHIEPTPINRRAAHVVDRVDLSQHLKMYCEDYLSALSSLPMDVSISSSTTPVAAATSVASKVTNEESFDPLPWFSMMENAGPQPNPIPAVIPPNNFGMNVQQQQPQQQMSMNMGFPASSSSTIGTSGANADNPQFDLSPLPFVNLMGEWLRSVTANLAAFLQVTSSPSVRLACLLQLLLSIFVSSLRKNNNYSRLSSFFSRPLHIAMIDYHNIL